MNPGFYDDHYNPEEDEEARIESYYERMYSRQDRNSLEDSNEGFNLEDAWQYYLDEEDGMDILRNIEKEFYDDIIDENEIFEEQTEITENNEINYEEPEFLNEERIPNVPVTEIFRAMLPSLDLDYYYNRDIKEVMSDIDNFERIFSMNSYYNIDSNKPIVKTLSEDYIDEIKRQPLKTPLLAHYYQNIAEIFNEYEGYEKLYNKNILIACSIWRIFYKKTRNIDKYNNDDDLRIMITYRDKFSKKAYDLINKLDAKDNFIKKMYYTIKSAILMDLYPHRANEALELANKSLNINIGEKHDSFGHKAKARALSLLDYKEDAKVEYKIAQEIDEKYKE